MLFSRYLKPTPIRSALTLFLALTAGACAASPEAESPSASAAPPQVEPEEPVEEFVAGPSPAEIKQAIDARNSDIRQCYLMGTFKNAQLAGTVSVTFTIDRGGKVSEALDAGSDIPDDEVVSCVLGVFAQLEFPAGASSETEVTYPISFGQHG